MDTLRTYTPEEVVARWLPTATPGGLRKAAQRRQIRHRRIGKNKQIVFTESDIEALLDGAAVEVGATPAAPPQRPRPAGRATRTAVSALPIQPRPARRIQF
ncbi:hypothetical protein GCM10027294_43430 [Marinactinospora endophytica]